MNTLMPTPRSSSSGMSIRPSATWASGVTDDHAPKNMLDITKRFEDNMLDAAVLRRFALAENAAHLVPRSPFYSRIKLSHGIDTTQ
jgi:hypothetical protein